MWESRKFFFPELLQTFIFHRVKFCLSQILATGPKLTINLRYWCKIFQIKTKHLAPPIFCLWNYRSFCFDFAMFVSCVFNKFIFFLWFLFQSILPNHHFSPYHSLTFLIFSVIILFHCCFISHFGEVLLYLWTFFFQRSSHIRWTFR